MIKIHIAGYQNRHFYAAALEQYHRQRYRFFVEEQRWQALRRADQRDIDAYDHQYAIHLLAMEGDKVVGGVRLNPCRAPILLEQFKELVETPIPYPAARCVDCSRFYTAPGQGDEKAQWSAAAALYCGVLEYCLDNKAKAITFVCYAELLELFAKIGWQARPLGPPNLIEGKPAIAALMAVTRQALQNVRRATGISRPVLTGEPGCAPRIFAQAMPASPGPAAGWFAKAYNGG